MTLMTMVRDVMTVCTKQKTCPVLVRVQDGADDAVLIEEVSHEQEDVLQAAERRLCPQSDIGTQPPQVHEHCG